MTGVLAGLLLPAAAVWLVLAAMRRSAPDAAPIAVPVALGAGLGLSSITTLWAIQAGAPPGPVLVALDAALWIAVAAVAAGRWRNVRAVPATTRPDAAAPDGIGWLARGAFAGVLVLAIGTIVADYQTVPFGRWDAWAIWNQKARFLFRGGEDWTAALAIPWSNPAHPLLVPASVARLWAYGDGESTFAPALVAAVFGLGCPAVVVGALGARRVRAWIAGAVVLAPAAFMLQVTAQQADVPLAFFLVASVAMLSREGAPLSGAAIRPGTLVAAGALAGLAAWTKNEGILFLGVMTALLIGVGAWRRRWSLPLWWAAGASPMAAVVAWFKVVIAPVPPPYLLEAQSPATIAGRLIGIDGSAMAGAISWRIASWGGPLAEGILPMLMAASLLGSAWSRDAGVLWRLGVVALMIGGYYAVYVATPLDALFLIENSFDRLLVQVWPLLVFTAFSVRWRSGEAAPARAS